MKALVLDTETTGFVEPELIEIAWVQVASPQDLSVQVEYWEYFKPSKPIEWGAMATHGILPSDLKKCKPSSKFKFPKEVDYLIGHNIDFDSKICGEPDVKKICTLALARKYLPELDSHKQSALVYYFKENDGGLEEARRMVKDAHCAKSDVDNCVYVLRKLIEAIEIRLETEIETWEQLWNISEDARVPEFMPFGKHKGEHIRDVPASYKQWLRRQDDVDPYILIAIDRYY